MLKTATFSGTNPVVGDLTVLGTELVGPVGGNQVSIAGNTAGNGVLIGAAVGSTDAAVNLVLYSKGAGSVQLETGTGASLQVQIVHTASSVNFLNLTGGATGSPPSIKAYSVTDTNVGLSLVPQGTGALLAAVPDNASTGGNARGTNAVDWQSTRAAATQVASGNGAAIGGGSGNTASGTQSAVPGGYQNTASGSYALAHGYQSVASGLVSFALGNTVRADGNYSVALGSNSHAHGLTGAHVFAAGSITTNGDAQAGTYVLRGRSTSGAAVRLTADGASAGSANVLNLPNNTGWIGAMQVVARDTATGDMAMWNYSYVAISRKATASTTAISTSGANFVSAFVGSTGTVTGDLAVNADTTNGGLNITFTPHTPNTDTWDVVAVYRTTEVQ